MIKEYQKKYSEWAKEAESLSFEQANELDQAFDALKRWPAFWEIWEDTGLRFISTAVHCQYRTLKKEKEAKKKESAFPITFNVPKLTCVDRDLIESVKNSPVIDDPKYIISLLIPIIEKLAGTCQLCGSVLAAGDVDYCTECKTEGGR